MTHENPNSRPETQESRITLWHSIEIEQNLFPEETLELPNNHAN